MNKVAKKLEKEWFVKHAGLVDRILQALRPRRAPKPPAPTSPVPDFAAMDIKEWASPYSSQPVRDRLEDLFNLSSESARRFSEVKNQTLAGERREPYIADYLIPSRWKDRAYARYRDASDAVEKSSPVGGSLPNMNLKEILDEQALIEGRNALYRNRVGKYQEHIRELENPESAYRKEFLDAYRNDVIAGKTPRIRIDSKAGSLPQFAEVSMPYRAGDTGVRFDLEKMVGPSAKSPDSVRNAFNKKVDAVDDFITRAYADRLAATKQKDMAAWVEASQRIVEGKKQEAHLDRFKKVVVDPLKNNQPVGYNNIKDLDDLKVLVESPLSSSTGNLYDRNAVHQLYRDVDNLMKAENLSAGDALKKVMDKAAKEPTDSYHSRYLNMFKHQRLKPDEASDMFNTVYGAKSRKYKEANTAFRDIATTGGLIAAVGGGVPYLLYKNDKSDLAKSPNPAFLRS